MSPNLMLLSSYAPTHPTLLFNHETNRAPLVPSPVTRPCFIEQRDHRDPAYGRVAPPDMPPLSREKLPKSTGSNFS